MHSGISNLFQIYFVRIFFEPIIKKKKKAQEW